MRCLLLAMLAIGCVEQGPGPQRKKVDPEYVQAHLLPAVPANLAAFDVAVGDGIALYLGNKLDKPKIAPGGQVTITHYWRALRSPGAQWNVFTLARGQAGTADFMNLPSTDMQIAHGPGVWQPGEIIEDVQTITLRPDWRSKEVTVLVGLIEQGKHGTLDRMTVVGPNTKDGAIVARVLEVDLSRAPPPKGTAYLSRAQGAINIDGAAGEAGWLGVPAVELVTAETSGDPDGKATVKMTWDDQFLYLFASVSEKDIVSPYKNQDDPLWKGDCVEIFIDADGSRAGYVELQANPLGVTFDSWFESKRNIKPGDEAWDSGMVAVAKLRGSVEANDSGDVGWDVELGIPWAAVKGKNPNMKVELPPRVGDRWRLNVVRVDRWSSAKPTEVRASSWNRISMGDFHALDRMLNVVFADATGSIVPQAKVPVSSSGFTTVTLVDEPEPGATTIELLDSGNQKVDGKVVPDGELLATLGARDPKPPITVSAGGNVVNARVALLFERARQAGISKIALLTQIDLTLVEQNPVPPATPIPHGIAMPTGTLELIAVASGATRVADKVLTDADLDRVLAAIAARDKQLQIVARPEGTVAFARVLSALELARIAGFGKLAIGTPVVMVPQIAQTALGRLTDTLELQLDNAQATFGGAPLDDEQVGALLRAGYAQNKNFEVVVRADGAVSQARVVAMFDLAKQAGFTKLSLATKQATTSPQPIDPVVDPNQPTLVVELGIGGGMLAGGKTVTDDELDKLFVATVGRDKATRVVIKADRGVAHARAVAVMQRARNAGLARLAFSAK